MASGSQDETDSAFTSIRNKQRKHGSETEGMSQGTQGKGHVMSYNQAESKERMLKLDKEPTEDVYVTRIDENEIDETDSASPVSFQVTQCKQESETLDDKDDDIMKVHGKIDSMGGRICLPDVAEVYFPEGVIKKGNVIEASLSTFHQPLKDYPQELQSDDMIAITPTINCGPDGIAFEKGKPVEVTITHWLENISNDDRDDVQVWMKSESKWIKIGKESVEIGQKNIKVMVQHFSPIVAFTKVHTKAKWKCGIFPERKVIAYLCPISALTGDNQQVTLRIHVVGDKEFEKMEKEEHNYPVSSPRVFMLKSFGDTEASVEINESDDWEAKSKAKVKYKDLKSGKETSYLEIIITRKGFSGSSLSGRFMIKQESGDEIEPINFDSNMIPHIGIVGGQGKPITSLTNLGSIDTTKHGCVKLKALDFWNTAGPASTQSCNLGQVGYTAINQSDEIMKLTITYHREVLSKVSYRWDWERKDLVQGDASLKVGLPFVDTSGGIAFRASTSVRIGQNQTTEIQEAVSHTLQEEVDVPPRRQVVINATVNQKEIKIPFRATFSLKKNEVQERGHICYTKNDSNYTWDRIVV